VTLTFDLLTPKSNQVIYMSTVIHIPNIIQNPLASMINDPQPFESTMTLV